MVKPLPQSDAMLKAALGVASARDTDDVSVDFEAMDGLGAPEVVATAAPAAIPPLLFVATSALPALDPELLLPPLDAGLPPPHPAIMDATKSAARTTTGNRAHVISPTSLDEFRASLSHFRAKTGRQAGNICGGPGSLEGRTARSVPEKVKNSPCARPTGCGPQAIDLSATIEGLRRSYAQIVWNVPRKKSIQDRKVFKIEGMI